MTHEDFYNRVSSLQVPKALTLETYLLSLLKLVEQKKFEQLTADLFLQLLEEALTSEPAAFDPEWLKIKKAPVQSEKLNGFDYAVAIIRFQISELRKMKGKQLEDPFRYDGIDSETGNRWYNFDPAGNLECGARCCVDANNNESELEGLEWGFLGELLEMGRIYE